MKKMVFGLSALLFVFLFASCGNPTERIIKLTEDIENNGDDWEDQDKWEGVLKDYINACCDFADTDPTEEEVDDYDDACKDFWSAYNGVDGKKVKKARDKAAKAVEKDKDLKKKVKAADKKMEKIRKKFEKDDDDD